MSPYFFPLIDCLIGCIIPKPVEHSVDCLIGSFFNRLIDCSTKLIDWLLACFFVYCLIDWLIDWSLEWFLICLIYEMNIFFFEIFLPEVRFSGKNSHTNKLALSFHPYYLLSPKFFQFSKNNSNAFEKRSFYISKFVNKFYFFPLFPITNWYFSRVFSKKRIYCVLEIFHLLWLRAVKKWRQHSILDPPPPPPP